MIPAPTIKLRGLVAPENVYATAQYELMRSISKLVAIEIKNMIAATPTVSKSETRTDKTINKKRRCLSRDVSDKNRDIISCIALSIQVVMAKQKNVFLHDICV